MKFCCAVTFVLSVASTSIGTIEAFVPHGRLSTRPFAAAGGLYAFDDADSLLNKLGAASEEVVKAAPAAVVEKVTEVAPPPPPPPAAVVEKVAQVVSTAPPPPVVEKAVEVTTAASTTSVQVESWGSGSALDSLPLPVLAGALVVVAAVAAISLGGGGEDSEESSPAPSETSSSSSSSPSPSDAVDLSIPYDAAARLAYEKAGSPGDFDSFKTKYYEDAVADVKAKQKVKA